MREYEEFDNLEKILNSNLNSTTDFKKLDYRADKPVSHKSQQQ